MAGVSRSSLKSLTQQQLVDDPYVNYGNLPYIAKQSLSSTALDGVKGAHPRKRSQVLRNTRTPVLRHYSEPSSKDYSDNRFLEKRRLTDVESVVKRYILRKNGSERPKQAYELVLSENPTVLNSNVV